MGKARVYDTSVLESDPVVQAAMDEKVASLWEEPYYWTGDKPDLELAKAITRIKITKGYGKTRLTGITVQPIEELRGVLGEMAFAARFGIRAEFMPPKYRTDGGKDFIFYGYRLDVKATVNPRIGALIRWNPSSTADVYVTINFSKDLTTYRFAGWAWYQDIMEYGILDHFGREYMNKPANHLLPTDPHFYPIDILETSLALGALEHELQAPIAAGSTNVS